MKVLIVDDDENSRIFLERTLRGRHYSTESASNGAAALEKAYQWRPDLIISDILMPGMNGFELCRRIKTDEQLRNVPFIFYTATFVDQKDEQLAMALGASRFLVKPMDPTDFFRVIEEVIQEYEQKTLSVPDQPLENMKVLCEMEEGSLARKLDKKVRALDREHKALIESEGRFRALTESTSDWIWEMDRNGVYTYSSPKVRDLLGYGVEEVIGKTPFDFMSPQERSHVAGLFRSIVRSKKPFQAFENTALHKDGSELVLEKSGVPFFDKRGGLEGYRGIDRDITERKRSEKALLVSEMKYRNLLEDIQLLAVMLDRDGNITFCNDYILALTGWTRADVMERNWFDLFIPEGERKNVRSVFTSGISDGTIVARYENSIVTREGTSKLIVWDNSVLRDHEGKAIGVASIGTDVTDLREKEEQFRQAQKMEAVGQLAGGIAHDFNNILTAIMSSGELLKMKIGSGNPLKTYVEYIMDASNRGASLVKKLLAFSRKEAFYPVTANLNEIIEGIGPLIKKIVPEDIDIHITPSHEVLTVMADRSLIEQVIINLVANSRDAMPSGGVISIGTGIMKLDDTFTGTHADLSRGEYAVVTVSDTGAGMDERTRERIFEPFFTTKEVGKGTGLGLSSAYGIIKQHNGGIHAHSTAGIGTTMTILLPLVHAAGEVTETEEAALPPGGNETILLVEDDPIVRGVTQSLLKEFGYTVIVAADGADAITLFAENKDKIRLALLDMIMPRMNGKEAYEFMKKMAPDIKTIFMSGYAEDILKTRSIIEDGLQYISKPVSPVELLTMVRKVLDEEI